LIRNSWEAINTLGNSQQGLDNLTTIFKLCIPLKNSDSLKNWLSDIYGNIAMANYPYETSFMNSLPAKPVNVLCLKMINSVNRNLSKDPFSLLTAIYNGINVYQNYTGKLDCNSVDSDVPSDISMTAWDYQVSINYIYILNQNFILFIIIIY